MSLASVPRAWSVALLSVVAGPAWAAAAGAPATLATVNGEPITVQDFDQALAAFHASLQEGAQPAPRQNPVALLDRLINAQLILQEARRVGIDELPEIKSAVDVFGRDTLREMLFQRQKQTVLQAAPGDMDRIYKNAVKEVKLRSVLVGAEADARKLEAAVKAGGNFDALARDLVAAGKAEAGDESRWVKPGELLPQVEPVVAGMQVGAVSPLLRVGTGFTMIKLLDARYPDDPAARRKAEQEALESKQSSALRGYTESLVAQQTKVDEKLLNGLDFEAKKPGFDALLKDRRPVATVKGEAPVTVADLADAIRKRFFHGVKTAVESKKINAKKRSILDDLLLRRAVLHEAKRLKIDQGEDYKAAVRDYRDSIVFGTFVKKVVAPEIKIEDAELKKYVADHPDHYRTPEMIQLEGVAFTRRADAEAALAKLRQGADLQWLKANAEGQVDPATAKDLLEFPPGSILKSALPPAVQKAVAGAAVGDYRFYADRDGPYYVLYVRSAIPARSQPFDAVKDDVAKKVFADKLQRAVDDWAAKLRAASEVKILASPDQLEALIGRGPERRR